MRGCFSFYSIEVVFELKYLTLVLNQNIPVWMQLAPVSDRMPKKRFYI